jgi:hypothetical protein
MRTLHTSSFIEFVSYLHALQDVSAVFEDLEELRQYVRRAGKFLPEKIDMVKYEGRTARESKQLFYDFRRDTDRARLAADVEIKVPPSLPHVFYRAQHYLLVLFVAGVVVERYYSGH